MVDTGAAAVCSVIPARLDRLPSDGMDSVL